MIGAGFSGGPVNPPLGHVCGDCMPAIRLLIKHRGDPYPVADAITDYKMNSFIDPEMALCSLNTIARKAETVSRGSVSHACILASEAVRDNAIYRRAVKVYDMMKSGKSVEDTARSLDDERKAAVEKRGSAILSGFTGHKIQMKFTVIKPQGRRTDAFTKKYWAFDSFVSYDISIDGKTYHIENLGAKAVPEFALNEKARIPGHGNSTLCRRSPHTGTAVYRSYHHQCDGPRSGCYPSGKRREICRKRRGNGSLPDKGDTGGKRPCI